MNLHRQAEELAEKKNVTPTLLMYKFKITQELAESICLEIWIKQKEKAKQYYQEYIESICR